MVVDSMEGANKEVQPESQSQSTVESNEMAPTGGVAEGLDSVQSSSKAEVSNEESAQPDSNSDASESVKNSNNENTETG